MAPEAKIVYLQDKLREKMKDPEFEKAYHQCDTEGCDDRATWIRERDGYQLCYSCLLTELAVWEISDFSPINHDGEASPTYKGIS